MKTSAPLHERVRSVTERIRERSHSTRGSYLERMREAQRRDKPTRSGLSCTNLAHGFAAMDAQDKDRLRVARWPNLAIVSSYNDMLSAHRPLERFPELIKLGAREAGAVAQFAGGVPAMCDGVTQGQPGMELSLFSRDVIALATAVGAAFTGIGLAEEAASDAEARQLYNEIMGLAAEADTQISPGDEQVAQLRGIARGVRIATGSDFGGGSVRAGHLGFVPLRRGRVQSAAGRAVRQLCHPGGPLIPAQPWTSVRGGSASG